MAPASWFLELRLDPATPALSGMGGGRAALTPLGRLVEEAWLDLPVLHGAGIDRFLIEPQGLLALVHWPAPA